MENGLIDTLKYGKRVTSSYAEVYFDDDYCDFQKSLTSFKDEIPEEPKKEKIVNTEWTSPSDLLIGIVELQPPFTSKITRGITHEGILSIGDSVLANEQAEFHARVNQLVNDNNAAWEFILDYEKKKINGRVNEIYNKIFSNKSKIMMEECYTFYESSLQDLENHLCSEIKPVLVSTHMDIISDLNPKIISNLKKEKDSLIKILNKRFQNEVGKVKNYYQILLKNEMNKHNKLINQYLYERNDALQAFVKRADQENITGTMYVMSTERKKCKIKQFIIENYQTLEITEKIQKIKEKQIIIDDYKKHEERICCLNKNWENKIKKILQLFLKFISFSLKLLPEQTTFLLDLERMVVLQLNELQKLPPEAPSILVEENIFKFGKGEVQSNVSCQKEPFQIFGDTAESIPTEYGSTETIPSHVDLPFVRLDRKYIFAKCHKFEEVKAFLDSQKCKCPPTTLEEKRTMSPSLTSDATKTLFPNKQMTKELSETSGESSFDRIFSEDFERSYECPAKVCQDWIKKLPFPYLDSYLNYTEENFQKLKTIIEKSQETDTPYIFNAQNIAFREVPYAETRELYNNVETQYSSQESLSMSFECICCSNTFHDIGHKDLKKDLDASQSFITETIAKRTRSLRILMQDHPNLLKIFTDESFDIRI